MDIVEKLKSKINFSKEKLKQYFTIFIILIFILSTLSLIAGLNTQNKEEYITAIAEAKAKIASYELELVVYEANEQTKSLIEEFRKQGKIMQTINFENEIIISLKNEEDVFLVSNKLIQTGAKIGVDANIELKDIELRLANGEKIKIENKKIRKKINPIFEVGEEFEVQFYTVYLNTSLSSQRDLQVENIVIKETKTEEKVLEVKPKKVVRLSQKIKTYFSWSERKNLEEFLATKSYELNYTKKIFDYVYIKSPVNQSILYDLAIKKPPYIIAIRESGIEVQKDFIAQEELEKFFKENNLTVSFPESYLEFENVEQKEIEQIIQEYYQKYKYRPKLIVENILQIEPLEIVDEKNNKYELRGEKYIMINTDIEPEQIDSIKIRAKINIASNKIVEYEKEEIKKKIE
ncbi:MAG: hypothetical protein N3D10_02090 [Candidatus Micrarchaeota archaeon]|nr:hypothetical protein [Candidatus Micrarchaeota archaeon]